MVFRCHLLVRRIRQLLMSRPLFRLTVVEVNSPLPTDFALWFMGFRGHAQEPIFDDNSRSLAGLFVSMGI